MVLRVGVVRKRPCDVSHAEVNEEETGQRAAVKEWRFAQGTFRTVGTMDVNFNGKGSALMALQSAGRLASSWHW